MVSCQGDDFCDLYHLEPMHTHCAWVSFLIAARGNGRSPKNCGFQSKTDHQQPNRRCETKRAAAKKIDAENDFFCGKTTGDDSTDDEWKSWRLEARSPDYYGERVPIKLWMTNNWVAGPSVGGPAKVKKPAWRPRAPIIGLVGSQEHCTWY